MSQRIGTVLVASSLTEASDSVVRAGVALARAIGARLHVAHAYDAPTYYYGGGPEAFGWAVPEMITTAEISQRDRLVAQLQRLGVAVDTVAGIHVSAGSTPLQLLDAARDCGADLLVMGATERGRLGRLLGSTADHVVRKAVCPVLIVRGEMRVPPGRVLAAVDLSSMSAGAVGCAARLLDQMATGPATAMDVLFVLSPLSQDVAWQFSAEQLARFGNEELARFVATVPEAVARHPGCIVRIGDARDEILAQTADGAADLLVLATHGRGGYDRMVLGSVASDVMSHAPCSVLMVPPVAAADALQASEAEVTAGPDWQYISDDEAAGASGAVQG